MPPSHCAVDAHRQEADRLGAPKPKDGNDMKMTSEKDLQAAFQMLDIDKDGKLTTPQAIDFLICAGWCLPEDELQEALGQAKRPWTLEELVDVLRQLKGSKKENLTAAKLSQALLSLSDHESLGLHHLTEVVCTSRTAAMTPDELEDLLEGLGVFDENMDCPALAKRIMDSVCDPPSERARLPTSIQKNTERCLHHRVSHARGDLDSRDCLSTGEVGAKLGGYEHWISEAALRLGATAIPAQPFSSFGSTSLRRSFGDGFDHT
ncbi:unnamed protein product [Durusdinium trenchii]|uniref:EF-hand domain-containing protein n=1 Tax=Durusdinium trenchii TaxID=1381693 RepID=A0ABP0RVN7_9DINO